MSEPSALCCSLLGVSFPRLIAPFGLGENPSPSFLLFWGSGLGFQRWLSCVPIMGNSLMVHTSHCHLPGTSSCHLGGPHFWARGPMKLLLTNLEMCSQKSSCLAAWEAGTPGLTPHRWAGLALNVRRCGRCFWALPHMLSGCFSYGPFSCLQLFSSWTRKIYFWVGMKWATLGQWVCLCRRQKGVWEVKGSWGWMGIGRVEGMGVEGNSGGRRRFGDGKEFGRWKEM